MSIVTKFCVACDACGRLFSYGAQPHLLDEPEKAEDVRKMLHTQHGWVEAVQEGKDICAFCFEIHQEYSGHA